MDFKINIINYSKTQMIARISLDKYSLLTNSERHSQMESLEPKSIKIKHNRRKNYRSRELKHRRK